MLILVGITTTVLNGGLFNITQNAVKQTKEHLIQENKLAQGKIPI